MSLCFRGLSARRGTLGRASSPANTPHFGCPQPTTLRAWTGLFVRGGGTATAAMVGDAEHQRRTGRPRSPGVRTAPTGTTPGDGIGSTTGRYLEFRPVVFRRQAPRLGASVHTNLRYCTRVYDGLSMPGRFCARNVRGAREKAGENFWRAQRAGSSKCRAVSKALGRECVVR